MMSKISKTFCLLLFVLSPASMFVSYSWASYTKADEAIIRISPEDARPLVESGQALLGYGKQVVVDNKQDPSVTAIDP